MEKPKERFTSLKIQDPDCQIFSFRPITWREDLADIYTIHIFYLSVMWAVAFPILISCLLSNKWGPWTLRVMFAEIDREKCKIWYEVFPIMILVSIPPLLLSALGRLQDLQPACGEAGKVKVCFSNGLCAKWLLVCGLHRSLTFLGGSILQSCHYISAWDQKYH